MLITVPREAIASAKAENILVLVRAVRLALPFRRPAPSPLPGLLVSPGWSLGGTLASSADLVVRVGHLPGLVPSPGWFLGGTSGTIGDREVFSCPAPVWSTVLRLGVRSPACQDSVRGSFGSGSLWEFDQSRVSPVPAGVSLGGRHPSRVCPCVLGPVGALQTHTAQIPNGIKVRANPGGPGWCVPPVSQVISRKVRSRSETDGSHSSSREWGWEWVKYSYVWQCH